MRPSQTTTKKPRRPNTEAVTLRPAHTTALPKYQQIFTKVLAKIEPKITPEPLTSTEAVTPTTGPPKYQQIFSKILTKIDSKITPKPLTSTEAVNPTNGPPKYQQIFAKILTKIDSKITPDPLTSTEAVTLTTDLPKHQLNLTTEAPATVPVSETVPALGNNTLLVEGEGTRYFI